MNKQKAEWKLNQWVHAWILAGGTTLLAMGSAAVSAEEIKRNGGTSQFVVAGYGFGAYTYSQEAGENSFLAGWSPIVLYRVGQNLLFETEVEFGLEGTETEVTVEYAQADWLVHNNLTIVSGIFLTPFGLFIERLHPVWINRLVSMPLPLGHHSSLVPFSQVGVQARGVLPLPMDAASRVTVVAYGSNGVSLGAGHGGGHGGEEGHATYQVDLEDTNRDKTFGGRVGIIPIGLLEVGGSFLSGKVAQFMTEEFEVTTTDGDIEEIAGHTKQVADDLDLRIWGVDLTLIGSEWLLRGEYLVQKKEMIHMEDGAMERKEAETAGYYVEAATRLSVIPIGEFNSGYLQPFEVAVRYSNLKEKNEEHGIGRVSVGINYYLADSAMLKIGYDFNQENPKEDNDQITTMLAVGF